MGMQVGGAEESSMMDINTTPLIDVMLVLLIMFIITIPVMTHAVKLDMPRGEAVPPPVPPVVINIEVDFDGTILWDGTAVPDEATLLSYISNAAKQDPQPEIHLRPNKRVKYDHVAKVLAASQRLGIRKIGFVGNEQFME
jgi:biopolymer transport protein ExbD